MRLLLISRCPPYPLHLGDRLIVYHLCQHLVARGHVIDLLAFFRDPGDLALVDQYRTLFRHVELIPEPARGTRDYLRRLGRMFPTSAEQAWSPAMWRAVEAHLHTANIDVVHLFGGVQVYEYRELVRYTANLIVPYESYSLFLRRELGLQWRTRRSTPASVWLRRWLGIYSRWQVAQAYERRMFSGYQRVIVLTEADAAAFRRLRSALPLAVIPNGIDPALLTRPVGQENREPATLLFLGNYEYPPNIDAALWLARDIFPRVLARRPDARLLLVGNAPPESLIALARSGEGRIEVTGRVPDVRPYYAHATLFVSPLRFGAGIKNKMLEAMASGLPVVATGLSADGIGLREGEHGLLGETAESLAAGILHLLDNPALRARLGEANRALVVPRFTWERVADDYESLYRTLLNAG